MTPIRWPHWCVALVLAGGAHALLLDAFVAGRPGTPDPGGGGITLSLTHGADRPGGPPAPIAPAQPESPPPAPEGAAPPAEAESEAGAMDSLRLADIPDGAMTVELEHASADRIVTEAPVPKPEARAPDARVEGPPEQEETGPQDGGEAAAAQDPVVVSSSSAPGSYDDAGGAGEPGRKGVDSAVRGYLLLVQSEFNQRKHYPQEAYSRGAEGTVRLRFVVARSGIVLSHEIDGSSGHAALDREVEALMRRVQPLPPFPPTIERDRLELVLPIGFYLRRP